MRNQREWKAMVWCEHQIVCSDDRPRTSRESTAAKKSVPLTMALMEPLPRMKMFLMPGAPMLLLLTLVVTLTMRQRQIMAMKTLTRTDLLHAT
jgi:hypothetical protein